MSRKIVSIVILVFTLMSLLTSCKHEHTWSEWEITRQPDHEWYGGRTRYCSCGESQTKNDILPIEDHNYVNGTCTICNLNPYEQVKNYIIKNGNYDNGYILKLGNYDTDQYYAYIRYYSNTETIDFAFIYQTMPGQNVTHAYKTIFTMSKYTITDGEYEYEAYCCNYPCDYPRINGSINPSEFSKSTSRLPHTSTHSKANIVAENCAKAVKGCFDKYFDDLLKDMEMTYSDLGFLRYE